MPRAIDSASSAMPLARPSATIRRCSSRTAVAVGCGSAPAEMIDQPLDPVREMLGQGERDHAAIGSADDGVGAADAERVERGARAPPPGRRCDGAHSPGRVGGEVDAEHAIAAGSIAQPSPARPRPPAGRARRRGCRRSGCRKCRRARPPAARPRRRSARPGSSRRSARKRAGSGTSNSTEARRRHVARPRDIGLVSGVWTRNSFILPPHSRGRCCLETRLVAGPAASSLRDRHLAREGRLAWAEGPLLMLRRQITRNL